MKSRYLVMLAILASSACDNARLTEPSTAPQNFLAVVPGQTVPGPYDALVQELYQRTNTLGFWGNANFSWGELDYNTSTNSNEFLAGIFFNDEAQTAAEVGALLDEYIAVLTASHDRSNVKGTRNGRFVTDCAYNDLVARANWLKAVAVARTTGQPDPPAPTFNCIATLLPNAAPTNAVAVQQADGTVKLTWQDNATNEGCYYIVRGLTTGGGEVTFTLPANSTQLIDSSVVTGVSYNYFVSACTNPQQLNLTPAAHALVTILPQAPAAPINLNAVLGSGGITVTWQDKSNNELSFVLTVLLNGTVVSTHTVPANTTSFLIASPVAGTYTFQLHATNAVGPSPTISKDLIVLPCNPHDNRNGDKCRPKPDPNPDKGKGKK